MRFLFLILAALMLSGCVSPPAAAVILWSGVAASSAAVVGVGIEAEQSCRLQGGCTHVILPP